MLRNILTFILLGSACTAAFARERRPPQNGQSARYICANGHRIEVLYGGGDAVITVGGAVAELDRAPDTEKEIYTGSGWIWAVTGKRSGLLASEAAPRSVPCQVG